MSEHESIILQTLVDLREQLSTDYTGDYTDMKYEVDEAIFNLLRKQNKPKNETKIQTR